MSIVRKRSRETARAASRAITLSQLVLIRSLMSPTGIASVCSEKSLHTTHRKCILQTKMTCERRSQYRLLRNKMKIDENHRGKIQSRKINLTDDSLNWHHPQFNRSTRARASWMKHVSHFINHNLVSSFFFNAFKFKVDQGNVFEGESPCIPILAHRRDSLFFLFFSQFSRRSITDDERT